MGLYEDKLRGHRLYICTDNMIKDGENRFITSKQKGILDAQSGTHRANPRHGFMIVLTIVSQANFWEAMRDFLIRHIRFSLAQRKSARSKL